MGGIDKRIIEVFFGSRPIDQVKTFESQDGALPQMKSKLLPEQGACLRYERTDIGTVICTLFPATTQASRQREDSIILEWIPNPRSLHSRWKAASHWRSFISYMQCTSVDGEPTALDKLRVGYLRFMHQVVVNGRAETTRFRAMLGSAFSYALTIGLSGFLLMIINAFVDSKDMDKLKTEQKALMHTLSEARGVITAQSERIAVLEQRIDAIKPVTLGPSSAIARAQRSKTSPRQ